MMKEVDTALTGEMSGHMFVADRYCGFDIDNNYGQRCYLPKGEGYDTKGFLQTSCNPEGVPLRP